MNTEVLFVKVLTKTDVNKRLSVPTVKKRCFLTFGGKHKVEFKVIDNKGKVWSFLCSIRKKKNRYPNPVLSKGWLQFVRCWELAVGDEVMVYRSTDKAGKVYNGIEVIRREVSPLVRNHGADRATAVASYTDVEEETTITSKSTDGATSVASYTDTRSTDQAVTSGQTEGLHDQPGLMMFEFINLKPDGVTTVASYTDTGSTDQAVTSGQTEGLHDQPCLMMFEFISLKPDRVTAVASYIDTRGTDQAVTNGQTEGLHEQPGLMMFEFISLKPDVAVSKPKVIKFLELGSREEMEMEYSSILTLHNINKDEIPVTSSTDPYFKFL